MGQFPISAFIIPLCIVSVNGWFTVDAACLLLNGGATIMTMLLVGAVFRDGILIEHPAKREEVPMAA